MIRDCAEIVALTAFLVALLTWADLLGGMLS